MMRNVSKSLYRLFFKDVCGCNVVMIGFFYIVGFWDIWWSLYCGDCIGGSWERCNFFGYYMLLMFLLYL